MSSLSLCIPKALGGDILPAVRQLANVGLMQEAVLENVEGQQEHTKTLLKIL